MVIIFLLDARIDITILRFLILDEVKKTLVYCNLQLLMVISVLDDLVNGVLEGITRMTALELCGELNVEAVTETLTVEAVRGADEVFITSTAGGIMSVSKIDGAPVGDGEIGPVTQRLTSLYWEKHTDPNWSTPVD